MARVKRAVNAHKKRRTTLESAAGYRGQRSRLYRKAKEQMLHSMTYAYRDRRARKGEFRKLWIQRIGDWRVPKTGRALEVEAEPGLVVEDVETGWCGAVVRVEKVGGMRVVHLEDRGGRSKGFPLGPGFLLEGAPVILTVPTAAVRAAVHEAKIVASRTASGSRSVEGLRARIASGSRIFVEGKHDAELVEKIWGDDLRIEGVVVEMLDGVDDLAAVICDFQPSPGRRLGVLVDHLVPGTKESRLVQEACAVRRYAPYVTILGHPYVDVWQSVRPERLGFQTWPVIPRGQSWKHGIVAELGWPHETQADIAHAWKRILATVRTYADLEPTLLASVEELIDFVTAPELHHGPVAPVGVDL